MCIKQIQTLSSRFILSLLVLICVALLVIAYIMEHNFGVVACKMCHYERYVFLGAGVLSFISLFFPGRFRYFSVLILSLVFLGGALLAGYHVAIQHHWVSLPAFCATNDFSNFDSVESLREQLLQTPFVRCDQVTWSLFGLSLAAYNTLLSLILAFFCWVWVRKCK